MTLQPKLDQAFDLLRSSSTELDQSFCLELEDRLMQEQQRQLSCRPWKRSIIWASIAICSILAVGAGSIAATGEWHGWLYSFWIKSDGTVTDQNKRAVGSSFQNEDGSHTTIIQPHGLSQSYEIRTEDSLRGSNVHLDRVDR